MSLTRAQQDVRDFHEKFGLTVGQDPGFPQDPHVTALRMQLVAEEAKELVDALNTGTLADVAKEAADVLYVVLGTMVSLGIELEPIWAAVHESNMAKTGGAKSPTGKVLKPPGWVKPDIDSLIQAQLIA